LEIEKCRLIGSKMRFNFRAFIISTGSNWIKRRENNKKMDYLFYHARKVKRQRVKFTKKLLIFLSESAKKLRATADGGSEIAFEKAEIFAKKKETLPKRDAGMILNDAFLHLHM